MVSLFIVLFFKAFHVAQIFHYFLKEPHEGCREGYPGRGTGTRQGPHFEHLSARRPACLWHDLILALSPQEKGTNITHCAEGEVYRG